MGAIIFRVMLCMIAMMFKYSSQECANIPPAFMPESFLLSDNPSDWFLPMKEAPTSDKVMGVIRGKDVPVGKGGYKTICFSVKLHSSVLNGPFNIECSFDNISQLTCEMTKTDEFDVTVLIHPLMPKYLQADCIKTDGSTYAIITLCFGGHTAFWFTISNVPTLSPVVQNEILDFLESVGLDTSTEGGLDYSIDDPAVSKGGC